MHITDDEDLEVCGDCLLAIANDDFTGMSDATERRVRAGIARLTADGSVLVAEGGEGMSFSPRHCECCGGLPGSRFTAHRLTYDKET